MSKNNSKVYLQLLLIALTIVAFSSAGYLRYMKEVKRIQDETSPDAIDKEALLREPARTASGNVNHAPVSMVLSLEEQLQKQAQILVMEDINKQKVNDAIRRGIENSTPDFPPRLPEGGFYPVNNSNQLLLQNESRNTISLWDPSTGDTALLLALDGYLIDAAAQTDHGIFLLVRSGKDLPSEKSTATSVVVISGTEPSLYHEPTEYIVYVSKTGLLLSSVLKAKPRRDVKLQVMQDQSLMIVGGKTWGDQKRSVAVERVDYAAGKISVQAYPDIPGALRHSYSLAATGDNRLMILGGNTSTYVSCSGSCVAETYLLDVESAVWTRGPDLPEPRSAASATQLPDGSVLVAGGWTPSHDWGSTPTQDVVIWSLEDNHFVTDSALPLGVASHSAVWVPGLSAERSQLLLGGGNVAEIMAYDVAQHNWYVAGKACGKVAEHGNMWFLPVLYREHYFFWKSSDMKPCETLVSHFYGLDPLQLTLTTTTD